MTKYSRYHIIVMIITFVLVGVLKGQNWDITEPILLDEMKSHRQSFDLPVEIIPYRIIPSDNPYYGCWSELDVMWSEHHSEELKERLLITIVNQELHQDIPDYVDIGGKSYYMIKLPIGHYWKD